MQQSSKALKTCDYQKDNLVAILKKSRTLLSKNMCKYEIVQDKQFST